MTQFIKADDGIVLRFWYDTERNEFQSQDKGRAVFDKVLKVEVISPASRESAPVYILERHFSEESGIETQYNEAVIARYQSQYKAFKDGTVEEGSEGMPIDKWPGIDIHQAAECKANRIYTVEALAAVPDNKLSVLGPNGRVLVAQAKAYLDEVQGGAGALKAAAEAVSLKEELDRLEREAGEKDAIIADLSSKLSAASGGNPVDVTASVDAALNAADTKAVKKQTV